MIKVEELNRNIVRKLMEAGFPRYGYLFVHRDVYDRLKKTNQIALLLSTEIPLQVSTETCEVFLGNVVNVTDDDLMKVKGGYVSRFVPPNPVEPEVLVWSRR